MVRPRRRKGRRRPERTARTQPRTAAAKQQTARRTSTSQRAPSRRKRAVGKRRTAHAHTSALHPSAPPLPPRPPLLRLATVSQCSRMCSMSHRLEWVVGLMFISLHPPASSSSRARPTSPARQHLHATCHSHRRRDECYGCNKQSQCSRIVQQLY